MGQIKNVSLIVLNTFVNDTRVNKIALSLAGAGYNARVISLYENGLERESERGGFSTNRIEIKTKALPKLLVFQVIKYLEFLVKSLKYLRHSQIIHCNDLNTLPIGVFAKLLYRNKKIIYDAHEYETEVGGLKGVRKKYAKYTEKVLIRYADRLITVSDGIAAEYVRMYGVRQPALVLNTPNAVKITKKQLFHEKFHLKKSTKVFLYQGGLNRSRGLDLILDTFSTLKDNKRALVVMGNGALKDKVIQYAESNNNIFYLPAVPLDELLDYTASADYGLLLYENTCLNHYYCMPNKLFEYMMADLPVIVSSLFELKRFVHENKVGDITEDWTTPSLIASINRVEKMNTNSIIKNIKQAKSKYNWENQERVLLAVYRELGEDSSWGDEKVRV